MLNHRTILLTTIVCTLWLTLNSRAAVQDDQGGKRELFATKATHAPTIDGYIGDPCWQTTPQMTDFVEPLRGIPVKDQTVAQLLYDDRAIYVAIRAFDSQPDNIAAQQMKDQVRFSGEDSVAFSIDPFHTHQFADRNFFIVNPLGAKYAHLAAGSAEKSEWLGLWKAAAQKTEDGWTVEMEIPWQMLAYPHVKEPVTMGLNFNRYQHRTGETSWWSNMGVQEFLEYDGHWIDVLPPIKKREIKVLPYTYLSVANQESGQDVAARAGMDMRYAVTPKLTLVGTANPDFENVELAVEGIDFSYGTRYVPDRRSFFLEGRNIFQLWEFFDSRQISEIDAGISLFGKASNRVSVGVLSTFHRGGDHNLILRTSHSPSATTYVGAAYLGHRDDTRMNSVAFVEGSARRGAFFLGGSMAQTWDEAQLGRHIQSYAKYIGQRLNISLNPFSISPDFVNKLGYHPFVGIRGGRVQVFHHNMWRDGILRNALLSTQFEASDRHDGMLFRRTAAILGRLETRSDYALLLGWDGGRYEEYRDGTLNIGIYGRASDQFTNYSIDYSRGKRANSEYLSIRINGSLRLGNLTMGLTSHLIIRIVVSNETFSQLEKF